MAGIICKQCGYENPDGSERCEICDEPLSELAPAEMAEIVTSSQETIKKTVNKKNAHNAPLAENIKSRFYVICPDTQAKTYLPDSNAQSYFCSGCQTEHIIDGIIWQIEEDMAVNSTEPTKSVTPKSGILRLDEVSNQISLEIDKFNGDIGRKGVGAEFFNENQMYTIGRHHCTITYEFNQWILRRVHKINDVVYNGKLLLPDEQVVLENGKLISLAGNTVTFRVVIE